MKRKIKNKPIKAIDPNIYRTGHRTDPIQKILTLLAELNTTNNTELIYKLSANKFLPKSLTQAYLANNYYSTYSVSRQLSQRNGIYWTLGIFTNCANIIRDFIRIRENFNSALLSSDFIDATAQLDRLDSTCLSWWSMENRIHLQKEINKEDTKDSIKSLERFFQNFDVKNKLGDLLLLSESNSVEFFAHSIQERLSEYRNSKSDQAIGHACCISLLMLPISYDHERVADLCHLYHYRNESIIDQYVLFKNTIHEIYASGRSLPGNLLGLITNLAELVGDEEILCTLENNEHPCQFVTKIVDEYTKGNYNSVVEEIRNALLEKSSHIFGLIEMYARACKYSETEFGTSLFDQAAKALADIVSVSTSSQEQIEYLNKLRLKFRNESWCKSLSFHLLFILQETNDSNIIELSRRSTNGMHKINTPKAAKENFTLQFKKPIDINEIPLHRAIRYDLKQQTVEYLDRKAFPIFSDYLKQQSKILIANQKWDELIDFSIQEYLSNKISFLFLPFGKICSKISEPKTRDSKSYISAIVILDIYEREANSAYSEHKTELFEEWLELHSTHMPSEVFEEKDLNAIELYFLSNICTPNQLDNIPTYEGDIDVIFERVTILNILIKFTKDLNGELGREKIRIIEDLFADKLRAKIEAGKLFVDVQAFTTHRKSFYKSLFDHVKSIKGGVVLEEYDDLEMVTDSKDVFDLERKTDGGVPLIASSSEKTDALAKLFLYVTKDFALNENYGLDKYLSAEIRHVVFEEQLRSCFEKTKLITIKENGEYLPNESWRSRYNFVQDSMLDRLDEAFKSFSVATDKALKETNNKFRVGIDFKKSGDYIFDFSPYYIFIVELSKIVEKSNNFDEFFKDLIDYMWDLTGMFAKEAQALINDNLKVTILAELDVLEQRVTHIKSAVPLTELMQEIRNARSYFNNSIEIVLSWFRFVDSDDEGIYEPLGVVVEAAVGSADSFFRHKNTQLAFTQNRTNLMLSYREARALFVALFTALENSFRYNHGSQTIKVEHTRTLKHDIVKISNNADIKKFLDPQKFIQEQKEKWADPKSKLSRKEGGAGLYKINNLLLNSSPGFSFDIELTGHEFSALVRLDHENFASRRQPL